MNATSPGPSVERAALRAVSLRLLPFLFLLYVFNILDRVNVGFARLQMLEDLDMSEGVYGLGFGVFYLGYFLFEVPSNLMLRRMGARRWISRILISWGLISVGHDVRAGAVELLSAAFSAGTGRGRLLSRHHPVPELLVSGPRTGTGRVSLHDRLRRDGHHRQSDFGCDPALPAAASAGWRVGNGSFCWKDCRPCCSASSPFSI